MNTELINKMRDLIISEANNQGVELSTIFKTNEELNNFLISKAIKYVMGHGKTIEEAYDFVLGDGAYKGIVN